MAPDGAGSIPNRDFVIAYRTGREGVRAAAYFERKPDAIGTFLLTITPPVAPPPDQVAAASYGGSAGEAAPLVCGNCGAGLRDAGALRDVPGIGKAYRCEFCGTMLAASPDRKGAKVGLPRDVVFLVDRSCSMRGQSLPQARRAVRLIVDALGDDDAVQLFAFDHDRLAFDGHGEAWVARSSASIKQIDAFLAGISARGGTELEEAIERASKLPARPGRARIVVLITDAALGNEGRLLRRAPEILGKETRLYVLGVGPAVNRYLVERLARAAGGASDVLLPTEDVETVVPRFARRLRQGGPALSRIKLAWDDALPADVYPSPIPDLFGGQTVQLLGRFAGSGKSRLVLTGEKATGEPFRQEVDVDLPEQSDQIPGLERLWARLRIDARLEKLARAPGEAADVRLEVLGLALKHKLLSPYTALVAEDSEKRVTTPAKRVDVAAIAPQGGVDLDDANAEEAEEEEASVGEGRRGAVDRVRAARREARCEGGAPGKQRRPRRAAKGGWLDELGPSWEGPLLRPQAFGAARLAGRRDAVPLRRRGPAAPRTSRAAPALAPVAPAPPRRRGGLRAPPLGASDLAEVRAPPEVVRDARPAASETCRGRLGRRRPRAKLRPCGQHAPPRGRALGRHALEDPRLLRRRAGARRPGRGRRLPR